MDEYEQIQRLRELWTRSINNWGLIFVPLCAGIVGLFLILFLDANTESVKFIIGFTGLLLFFLCTFYWRYLVNNIDEQIVELYPSMLRLDRAKQWETQNRYFYNNLSRNARAFIRRRLQHATLSGHDYERFIEEANRRDVNHLDLLGEVWTTFGPNSVSSRGHQVQDLIIYILNIALLVAIGIYLYTSLSQFLPYLIVAFSLITISFFMMWQRFRWLRLGQQPETANNQWLHNDLLRPYLISHMLTYFVFGLLCVFVLLSTTFPQSVLMVIGIIVGFAWFILHLIVLIRWQLLERLGERRFRNIDYWNDVCYWPVLIAVFSTSFLGLIARLINAGLNEYYIYVITGVFVFVLIFMVLLRRHR